jgi:hypothetical protein
MPAIASQTRNSGNRWQPAGLITLASVAGVQQFAHSRAAFALECFDFGIRRIRYQISRERNAA